MKKVCIAAFLVSLLTVGVFAEDAKNPLSGVDNVVWAGIDFSLVKMIGSDFNKPNEIFPGMLEKWNGLFVKERIGKLESAIDKKVVLDVAGVEAKNKLTKPDQIITAPGPDDEIDKTHITDKDISAAVRSLKLKSTSGIGLVYIVDRFVKSEKDAAVFVVYFDIKTRAVVHSKRVVESGGGFGFRNFWFRALKEIDPEID